jgi:hypothetical protein
MALSGRLGGGAMPKRFVIRALTLPLRGVPLPVGPVGEGLRESQESRKKQEIARHFWFSNTLYPINPPAALQPDCRRTWRRRRSL